MADEKEEIKIVDRRRFDAEGKDRSIDEDGDKPNPKPEQKKASEGNGDKAPVIDFSSFVMSFATQALMQLGEIEAPAGVTIPKDIRAAKQTIDILSMLESKTKGNLDQREALLIEDILHNLRITFIKASSAKQG